MADVNIPPFLFQMRNTQNTQLLMSWAVSLGHQDSARVVVAVVVALPVVLAQAQALALQVQKAVLILSQVVTHKEIKFCGFAKSSNSVCALTDHKIVIQQL